MKPEPWWPLNWISKPEGVGDEAIARTRGHPTLVRVVRTSRGTRFDKARKTAGAEYGAYYDESFDERTTSIGDYETVLHTPETDLLVVRSILLELAYPGRK